MTNEEQLQTVKRWRDARDEIGVLTRQIEPLLERKELLKANFKEQMEAVNQLVSTTDPIKLFTLGDCAVMIRHGEEVQEIPVTGSITPVIAPPARATRVGEGGRVIKTRKRVPRDMAIAPIVVEKWDMIEPLFYWMNERERIRIKKDAGEKAPWTDDPILREFSFCNVFREDDRVTQWIRKNWREPYADHPNLWFAMCAARQINWPPSLAAIGFPAGEETITGIEITDGKQKVTKTAFDITKWKENSIATLEKRQAEGHKIYTGAYMLRADPASPEQSKIRYTFDKVLLPPWNSLNLIANDPEKTPFTSIEATVNCLSTFYAYGGFLAYEVATDMRWTRYGKNWPDIYDWANPGPGAVRGLNRLFGRPVKDMISKKQALAEMQFLLAQAPKYLGKHVKQPIELRDIEGGLCETDKHLRVKNGEGRPRAKFEPNGRRDYEI